MNDALISVRPRYVASMLAGEKTVELRRRSVKLPPGTRLWIYSTLPSGCIEATATIGFVDARSPTAIWRRYAADLGLSREEFRTYVNGCRVVCAIKLDRVTALQPSLGLDAVRSCLDTFHPPQFFMRLEQKSPLLTILVASQPTRLSPRNGSQSGVRQGRTTDILM